MFRSLAGSLFPSPEVLKQLYGDRRNRMLPVHYSRFMKCAQRNGGEPRNGPISPGHDSGVW